MKDKLNTILQAWAEGKVCPEPELRRIQMRIVAEASRRLNVMTGSGGGHVSLRIKLGYAGLGAGLAVVIGLVCLRTALLPPEGGAGSLVGRGVLTDPETEWNSRVFREIERLFPENLRWVSESNGDLGMGLETTEDVSAESARLVLVKIVVVSRGRADVAWRPVWSAEVVLRSQYVVEIHPNKDAGNKLAMWVCPLADGNVAMDVGVSLEEPVRLFSSVSTVLSQNEPTEQLFMRDGEMECKVVQTVKVL